MYDIGLIKEPWNVKKEVSGLNLSPKNVWFFFTPKLSTADATILKQGNRNIKLASVYLPYDTPKESETNR